MPRAERIVGNKRDEEPADVARRNLAVANPDPAFLPSLKPIIARVGGERRLYTDVADNAELIALMRTQLVAERVDATHMGFASGAMDAIERGLLAMTAPGDVIGLEDPTYPLYVPLAQALGLRIARLPIDAHGITPEALTNAIRDGAKAIVVVPRAQNPTGASFDLERARALRAILSAAPHVGVIEDDFLALVCGVELHSITHRRERWLYVRSLAKTIGPDLRVAPFAADGLTLARIVARQQIGYGWVSNLLQDTVLGVLASRGMKRRIAAATTAYATRRTIALAACQRHGLRASGAAGFTVWIHVADESAAVRAAAAAGFAIDGGARYRDASPPAVRITITTIREQEADALARVLASANQGP